MIDQGEKLIIDSVEYMRDNVRLKLHIHMDAKTVFHIHLTATQALRVAGLLMAAAGEAMENKDD